MAALDEIKTFQSWDRLKDWLNDKWNKQDKKASNIKWTFLWAAMSVLSTTWWAHSQDITGHANLIEPVSMWEVDTQIEAWIISILLKAAAAWFDMDNFRYEMTINPSIKDEIHVLSNPLVLATTRAISRDFLNETWINLEIIDVIAIAKVVQTKFSFASDPLLFEDTLLDFLSHYSAHQDAFSKILWKYLSDAVT